MVAGVLRAESQAPRDLILSERPAAALFYHSAANGIYAGECNGDHDRQSYRQCWAKRPVIRMGQISAPTR
ncbi:MAG: hypothetical protein U0521_15500 [Anaerolineae bacterium]